MDGLMSAPKTMEEARLLPELDPMDYLIGPHKLGPGIDGDSIILFVDDDGISKKVVDTDNGFFKVEWI